jgi:hypothetical protein
LPNVKIIGGFNLKNKIKIGLLLFLIIMLVGCGNDSLVASKDINEFGFKFKEIQEITIKNNKVIQIKNSYQFITPEDANNYYKDTKMSIMQDRVSIENNKIIMTIDIMEESQRKTKKEYKKQLEEAGYSVK